MSILERVSHPNLIRTYEFLHDDKYFYIVMELAKEGQFLQYFKDQLLNDANRFTEKQLKFIAKQLFSALEHLHHNGIAHMDVKPSNILITGFTSKGPIIKLTNFGFARVLQ